MNKWIKRALYVLAGAVGLVACAAASVYGLSERRFRKSYAVSPETIAISDDSTTLARGRHLATVIGKCVECHGESFQGTAMIDAAPMGRLVAPNLTSGQGGVGGDLTPADFERAIRHGVAPNGRPLVIMPANDYQYLSDSDVSALISYLKKLPPANNVLAPSKLMMLPRALLVFAGAPFIPAEEIFRAPATPMTVTPGPTAEYGGYLAWVGGCKGCHGPNLSGGKSPGGDPSWPPAANLTPAGNLGKWTEEQFVQTLRTGKRPDGSPLNEAMPWKLAGQMSDVEMHAVYAYLRTVPSRAFGNH
jgi:mono/diheme cytochrome c family protein